MQDTPASRPLIEDVAARAGVSRATVDRVLNRRPGVRARTVERVLEAAAALDYLSAADVARMQQPEVAQYTFLLPRGGNPYLRLLGARLREIAAQPTPGSPRIRCHFEESFNPAAMAEALRRHGERSDGVAFMAVDHPLVRAAADHLVELGKRVVTLVSDVPNTRRHAYIGLENRQVGRTAGYLMARFAAGRSGSVALIAASRAYHAHGEREIGFLSILDEMMPGLRLTGTREGHDDRDENYHHARELIARNPDLVGIYNVGGSSDGIARALRESGRRILFIGHALTPDTRAALLDETMDACISQSPEAVITTALRALAGAELPAPALPMLIMLRENLD
ncbi:LacI family transcriptional regulator (plasmid) [Paroceanicella profunda]|uniref:LacI family transcriptional regulator n=1 Tax=Paroceanicella profunda TaxID=2579971 RepID=A0A5B8FYF0_9RHOB|nr:LacI family DNA-binding transcriptional regulator [Paroceanicella profunda]QDL93936.1 LacI family transcriptional regulator [Paroceanicella profunda]